METQTAPGGLREELRSDAGTISHAAKDRLSGELDARKGVVTEQAKTLSTALDRAAGELDHSPDWLRSIFEQGAQTLQRFADTVERKDARQLTGDVQQLARENPGTFLAGCALAGFAAARVLKAGAGTGSPTSGSTGYEPYAADEPAKGSAMAFPGGVDPQAVSNQPLYGDVA